MAKTGRRSRRTPHAGGRPLNFIPTAVVQRAGQLYELHRRWSYVLEQLEREGNGRYARNTLIRRVQASTSPAAVQNYPSELDQAEQLEELQEVSKTGPGSGRPTARSRRRSRR